jgi:hypothetical protein
MQMNNRYYMPTASSLYTADHIITVNTLKVDRQFSPFVTASIQHTVPDLNPCIQLISLETWASDNSTKEVIL